ncbi:MAG: hypothetical protein E7583_02140 [Ruminococcaceae bacterium]|nr:hypothetical protein [Oscillospiraceae bacterium]
MTTKRTLALLLAALMAGTSVLSSCGKKEEKKEKGESGEIQQTENDGPPLVLPPAEEVSDGDETFDIFLAYGVFDADYIVEEETGDTIKDIIYQRNREVEDYFGFEFNFRAGAVEKSNSSATPTIRTQIQAGDDTYEVYMNVQHAGMPLIYEDLFVEWTENMPHANLDNPWWYQNVKRDLNFGDKIYVMVGDYNFHCLKASGAIAFNKTIMDELEMEYPYQLVKDGEWTIDKFIEYVKAGQKDLNGDGLIKPEDDRLGFSGWKWEMIPAMFVGMGGSPVAKDDDNLPMLNVNNERTFNVIDKLIELYDDGNGAWDGGNTYGVASTMFKESRLLFQDTTLTALPGLRELEDDFGAVPYPKLDEDQEDYYSRIVNFSSLTYIPVTNQKLELTSAVLEYMAYISHQNLIPAFYDEILNIKTARDFETEEMIDIIREGARFMDENYLTSGGIINIVASGNNTLSSNYASQGDAWETKLETIIEFWEA